MTDKRPLVVDAGQLRQAGSEEELDTDVDKRLTQLELALGALVRWLVQQGFEPPADVLALLERE